MAFNKSLFFIVALSSVLLSTHAFNFPAGAPAPSPVPSVNPTSELTKTAGLFGGLGSNLFNLKLEGDAAKFRAQIQHFCTGTENPVLCAKTIAPFVHGFMFDPFKALEAEMKITLNVTLEVHASIVVEVDSPATQDAAKGALHVCKSCYKNMIETIQEALELVQRFDVVDAYYKFSSVLSDRSACDDAFVESKGVTNPISEKSALVYQLGGNCLAIMDGWINNHNNFLF
ncbi:hypothetical protein HN51_014881 [Arachis hypogaea]|uniref:Pectinesterase inhibitor domain-containing protein n=1 Tax=Arachis hypogaea TaxID=3818 RepID=A0A445CMP6_ARAHY|nr:uncharacterized protein DS421_6g176060 [Arachis hypogaea]RYR52204.1 hypothetical protein Ahy_A06g027126 [Arachis hypogaea]